MKRCLKLIVIDDDIYEVEGLYDVFKDKKFTKNKAYAKDDMVYIYGGKFKSENNLKLGHFYKDGDEYRFIDGDPELCSVDKIIDTTDAIENLDDATAFKEVDPNIVDTSELKIFAPPLKDDDDIYKKIIKTALIQKQIDLKQYRDQFSKEYGLTNLKASLSKPGIMTVKNYNKWCEILGLTTTIVVTNSGTDKISSLKEEIVIVQ